MTKYEAADRLLGTNARNYDCALPQAWVNECTDLLDMDVRPHIVWLYDNAGTVFGRPFAITSMGRQMIRTYNRVTNCQYPVDEPPEGGYPNG